MLVSVYLAELNLDSSKLQGKYNRLILNSILTLNISLYLTEIYLDQRKFQEKYNRLILN